MRAVTAIKNLLSLLNGSRVVSFFFSLLVLSIPMQHKFDKMFRSLSKLFRQPEFKINGLFETKVFFCIFDLLLLALLISIVFTKKIQWRSLFWEGPVKYLSLFFLVTLFSILVSQTSGYGLQYIRWFQLVWVGSIVFILAQGLIGEDKKRVVRKVFLLLVIAGAIQSFIAIIQYFSQHHIGLAKLGELYIPPLSGSRFAMSDGSLWIFDRVFSVVREQSSVLRAYGTFPYPNSLGGFLVLSLFSSYYLYTVASKALYVRLLAGTIFFQVFALFITYSRSALFGWVIGSFVWFVLSLWKVWRQKERARAGRMGTLAMSLVISTAICIFCLYPQIVSRGGLINYSQTLAQGADRERAIFQTIAIDMIKSNPLMGIGFNSFTLNIEKYSQVPLPPLPVHNMFLLIAAEIGIIGLLFFVIILFFAAFRMIKSGLDQEVITLFSLFTAFLFIGCCDCYFLDGPECKPMFFTLIGLIAMMGKRQPQEAIVRNIAFANQ